MPVIVSTRRSVQFHIIGGACFSIIFFAILISTLLALVDTQAAREESVEASNRLVEHLAAMTLPAVQRGDYRAVEAEVADALRNQAVMSVQILDASNKPRVAQKVPGYVVPHIFQYPPLLDVDNLRFVVTQSEAENEWRFTAPLVSGQSGGTDSSPLLEGYIDVIVSKKAIADKGWNVLWRNLSTALPLSLLISLLVAGFIRTVYRPVQTLANALSGVSLDASELKSLMEGPQEISSSFGAYQRGMSAARDRERALRQSRDAALEAGLSKAQFVANMSHQVRTPLNGIVGMLDMLRHTELTKEQREQVDIAWNSADGLINLLNRVLDFSRIEAGKTEMKEAEFDLHRFTADVVRVFMKQAELKGVVLHSHVNPEVPATIRGDQLNLRQVLSNLLDNALKYTDRGEILLMVSKIVSDGFSFIEFTISDTGIGMDESRQQAVFDFYTRAVDGHRIGTGLGLAIAKQLVTLMGGEIKGSSAIGAGSTFAFTIPLKAGANATLPEQTKKYTKHSTFQLEGKQIQRLPVLVVDDNRINQRVACQMLELLGFTTQVCDDGSEAVRLTSYHDFAYILMDCNMPVMDGYEAVSAIRQRELGSSKHAVIIGVSANNQTSDRLRCIDCGMDDVLPKPLTLARLRKALGMQVDEEGNNQNPAREVPLIASDQVLDPVHFAALRETLGSRGINELVTVFFEDIPAYLQALESALSGMDQASSILAAHSIKACSLQIGASNLAQGACEVELEARRGQLQGLGQCVRKLRSEYQAVEGKLNAEIKSI